MEYAAMENFVRETALHNANYTSWTNWYKRISCNFCTAVF